MSVQQEMDTDLWFRLKQENSELRRQCDELREKIADLERKMLSPMTLELAHRALIEMRKGVEPWAAINDEIDAQNIKRRLDQACEELRVARGLPPVKNRS